MKVYLAFKHLWHVWRDHGLATLCILGVYAAGTFSVVASLGGVYADNALFTHLLGLPTVAMHADITPLPPNPRGLSGVQALRVLAPLESGADATWLSLWWWRDGGGDYEVEAVSFTSRTRTPWHPALLAGRFLSPSDSGRPVAVLGVRAAQELDKPLGSRLDIRGTMFRVVGLVGGSLGSTRIWIPVSSVPQALLQIFSPSFTAIMLPPYAQHTGAPTAGVFRSPPGSGDPGGLVTQQSVATLRTRGQAVPKRDLIVPLAFAGGLFVCASLNLAFIIGVWTTLRRRELTVRLALGATPWRVLWMILVETLSLAAAGCAVGAGVIAAVAWWAFRNGWSALVIGPVVVAAGGCLLACAVLTGLGAGLEVVRHPPGQAVHLGE